MPLGVTNLVGFGGKRAAAGGGGDTFTFIGETTSTGYSVSYHGSAAAGDWAILAEAFDGTTALAGSPGSYPTGYAVFDDTVDITFLYTGGGRDIQWGVYRKQLTSGDISGGSIASAVTGGADTYAAMACQIWRPSSTVTFSDQDVATGGLYVGGPASVTSSSGTPPTLVIGYTSAYAMASVSPAFDQVTTVGATSLELGVTFYSSSPSDQTLDNAGVSGDRKTWAAYSNLSFA